MSQVILYRGGAAYVELYVKHMYVNGNAEDMVSPRTVDTLANTSACTARVAPGAG